jgi:hypothetical protein
VLDRICGSFKFKKVVEGVSAERAPSPEVLAKCTEAGKKLVNAVAE